MMIKEKDIFEIWELPRISSLNILLNILKLDYTKTLDDSTLKNYWGNFFEEDLMVSEYTLEKIDNNTEKIKYISTIAHYEEYSVESNAKKPVFFFQYNQKIYCILFGSSSSFKKIKSNLMGMTRPKTNISGHWKEVKIHDKNDFKFGSDFYKWLYSKNKSSILTKYGSIEIKGIGKIKNSDNLEEDFINEITGLEITNDLVTKVCLADSKKIEELGLSILHKNFDFLLNFNHDGQGKFYRNKSYLITDQEGKFAVTEKDYHKVSILIVILILQGLKEKYNDDISKNIWTKIQNDNLEKTESIDIIKKLIKKHNLSEEIKNYLNK
ncbi:MAG: hypothetical protein ACRC6U_10300 [Fusobacteriaceae bacterium]